MEEYRKIRLLPEQVEILKTELERRHMDSNFITESLKSKSEEGYARELNDLNISSYDPIFEHDIAAAFEREGQLEALLKRAEVVNDYNAEQVDIGTKFELSCDYGDNDVERNTYILVDDIYGRNEENPYISINSPIGKSAYGKKVGEKFIVRLPKGDRTNKNKIKLIFQFFLIYGAFKII